MLEDRSSPAQEAGEAIRQLHPLRQWVEIRDFYRAVFRRGKHADIARLTALTASVWDHPDRYR